MRTLVQSFFPLFFLMYGGMLDASLEPTLIQYEENSFITTQPELFSIYSHDQYWTNQYSAICRELTKAETQTEALKKLKTLSDSGFPPAMLHQILVHESNKQKKEAQSLYERLVEKNDPRGCKEYAKLLQQEDVESSLSPRLRQKKVLSLLERAAYQTTTFYNQSYTPITIKLLYKSVIEKLVPYYEKHNNLEKSIYYGHLASLIDPDPYYPFVVAKSLYAQGKKDLALNWLERPVNAHYPPAQNLYALYLFNGESNGVINKKKAIELLEDAAEQKYDQALLNLGKIKALEGNKEQATKFWLEILTAPMVNQKDPVRIEAQELLEEYAKQGDEFVLAELRKLHKTNLHGEFEQKANALIQALQYGDEEVVQKTMIELENIADYSAQARHVLFEHKKDIDKNYIEKFWKISSRYEEDIRYLLSKCTNPQSLLSAAQLLFDIKRNPSDKLSAGLQCFIRAYTLADEKEKPSIIQTFSVAIDELRFLRQEQVVIIEQIAHALKKYGNTDVNKHFQNLQNKCYELFFTKDTKYFAEKIKGTEGQELVCGALASAIECKHRDTIVALLSLVNSQENTQKNNNFEEILQSLCVDIYNDYPNDKKIILTLYDLSCKYRFRIAQVHETALRSKAALYGHIRARFEQGPIIPENSSPNILDQLYIKFYVSLLKEISKEKKENYYDLVAQCWERIDLLTEKDPTLIVHVLKLALRLPEDSLKRYLEKVINCYLTNDPDKVPEVIKYIADQSLLDRLKIKSSMQEEYYGLLLLKSIYDDTKNKNYGSCPE